MPLTILMIDVKILLLISKSNTVFLETISLFGYILEFIEYSNRELYMNF